MAAERFLQLSRGNAGLVLLAEAGTGRSFSSTRRDLLSAEGSGTLDHGNDPGVVTSSRRERDQLRAIAAALLAPDPRFPIRGSAGDAPAGEGVGLSIVKRLCELLDAGLELATKPGQGSAFRVILPRSYDDPSA